MTKKYNGYFLCILLMLLISIACMLVVINVQVEAEGEIQYNLTLYYSEEDVGTSYLFADGTQISLPNDLSDYDENYKYTFYSYDSENSLYRTNYKLALTSADKSTCTETIYDSTKTVEEDSDDTVADIYFKAENNFSVLGNHIYFYIPYEGDSATGYYLNRINLLDSEKTLQLVGVVQQDHIKTEENTEE